MISFYVTKADQPFTVGKSKNDTFLTIGARADNDIILTDLHAAPRFLMVKIQTGILKVSCVGSIRGLKVQKSSLSSGQDKLIPGSGKAPITVEDYTIYIKIGSPDESWPKYKDINPVVKLPEVDKIPSPPQKPKISQDEDDLISTADNSFSYADRKPADQKPEKAEEKKGKIESIFDDDFDDSMEYYSANGKQSQEKKESRSSVADLRQELQNERIKQEQETERREKEKAQIDEKPVEASPFDDEMLKSFDTSKVSDKSDIDAVKKDFSLHAGSDSDTGNFGGLFGEGEEEQDYSIEEEAEEIIMDVTEVHQDADVEFIDTDFESPEVVDKEDEAVELDEFGEVVETSTVSEQLELMLKESGEQFDEFVNDTKIISTAGSARKREIDELLSDEIILDEDEDVLEEPEIEIFAPKSPTPAAVSTSSPPKMKRKMASAQAKKEHRIMPAPIAQPAEMPAQKMLEKTSHEHQVGIDIERKTTVRYYKQMKINKNFPLLVVFSKEEIEHIVQRDVVQVEAKEKVRVKSEKPVVNVVPQFPGCICVPERQEVDLTPENTEVTFWITPVAEGKLPTASINVHYEGKIIQKIECPTHVAKSTAAKVTASAAVISPIFFSAIESVGLDPKAQMETGFPLVKQIANWLENLSISMFGVPIMSGMTLMGLIIGFIAFIAAIFFFIKSRPKESDPIDDFLSFKFMKNKHTEELNADD